MQQSDLVKLAADFVISVLCEIKNRAVDTIFNADDDADDGCIMSFTRKDYRKSA